jgi:spore maturation protein CgeB
VVSDWDDPREQASDVVIHLRGRTPYATKPGSLNAMWMISHPEEITDAELAKYDVVAVASTTHAAELATRLTVPVHALLQATSSRYLQAVFDADLAVEVLFVGNSRGERRPIVDWAIEAGLGVTVFGSGWENLIPPKYIGGAYFPNDRLPDLYRSAGVVLNDHWPDMAAHGFISNRIFDALGAGATVISDRVAGLDALFGEAVITVTGPGELAAAVRAAGSGARSPNDDIAPRHTFGARAETLEAILRPLLGQRETIPGGRPTVPSPRPAVNG